MSKKKLFVVKVLEREKKSVLHHLLCMPPHRDEHLNKIAIELQKNLNQINKSIEILNKQID